MPTESTATNILQHSTNTSATASNQMEIYVSSTSYER